MALANSIRSGMTAAAFTAALALAGCGIGGTDLVVDAPVLDAVGINLSSKPKVEEDLPERPGLVVPPSVAALPKPGERSQAAQNWPTDPDEQKKKKAELEAEAKDKYCREGDWSDKAGIREFEKNTGREARCSSKIGEALSKTMGGGEAKATR